MGGWTFMKFSAYGKNEQLDRLFHAWLYCFTLLKLGAAQVCALGVLLVELSNDFFIEGHDMTHFNGLYIYVFGYGRIHPQYTDRIKVYIWHKHMFCYVSSCTVLRLTHSQLPIGITSLEKVVQPLVTWWPWLTLCELSRILKVMQWITRLSS